MQDRVTSAEITGGDTWGQGSAGICCVEIRGAVRVPWMGQHPHYQRSITQFRIPACQRWDLLPAQACQLWPLRRLR